MDLEKEISKRYNGVAEKYFHIFQSHSYEQIEALEEFKKLLPPDARVLDSGCGTGKDAVYLFKKGLRITGIDISPGMLHFANVAAENEKQYITFLKVNMQKIPFPDKYFQGVWSNSSFAHIVDKDQVMDEWNRVLTDKGVLHLWIQNPVHPYYVKRIEETKSEFIKTPNYAFYEGAHWFYNTQDELINKFEKHNFTIISKGNPYQRYISIFARKDASKNSI